MTTVQGHAGTDLETAMQAAPDPQQASFITFTAPFNYSGHPTLTLPIDRYTVDWRNNVQLPRSVQLVATKVRPELKFPLQIWTAT